MRVWRNVAISIGFVIGGLLTGGAVGFGAGYVIAGEEYSDPHGGGILVGLLMMGGAFVGATAGGVWAHRVIETRRSFPERTNPVQINSNRILILFGAGASFGSEFPGVRVPPLSARLYDELRRFSPELWGALPTPYPDLFRTDFEDAFRQLGNDSPSPLSPAFNPTADYPAKLTGPLLRKMAQFFLEFVPTDNSLYLRLAEKMKKNDWRGVLASLNYDLLLPIALDKSRMTVCVSPWADNCLRLCLPHGSSALLIEPDRVKG